MVGFLIDSVNTIAAIKRERKNHNVIKITKFVNNPSPSIRNLAPIIGSVTFSSVIWLTRGKL